MENRVVIYYRRLPRFEYLVPQTVEEALSLLSRYKGKAKVIAGGTDVIPKLKRRETKAPAYIIDLKGIAGLDYIKYDEAKGLTLGALVTMHAVEASPIIQQKFKILLQAAQSMASPQVRNRGTVAGNICNAVPSADTAPALLTLEAKLKLTPRSAMDLAIVGVAVLVILDGANCKDIRIALGAVAPTPMRAKQAEAIVKGQRFSDKLMEKAAEIVSAESRPIDDHRASAEYRRGMVKGVNYDVRGTGKETGGNRKTTTESGTANQDK